MEEPYNSLTDTHYLKTIAYKDYAGARILWNLEMVMPALHLLHESVEKYLKVLWLKDKTFKNLQEYTNALKKFSHNFNTVFASLNLVDRERLNKILKNEGLVLYHLEGLRYGTNLPGVGYSDELFKAAELFIKEIRLILGESPAGTLHEDLLRATHPGGRAESKKSEAIKLILSIKRKTKTKKERKTSLREFKSMMARWDGKLPPQLEAKARKEKRGI